MIRIMSIRAETVRWLIFYSPLSIHTILIRNYWYLGTVSSQTKNLTKSITDSICDLIITSGLLI